MAHWILKSEPSVYAFAQLLADRRTVWDGIRNAQALIHLRAMAVGDDALIYHSNEGKALVGLARIARSAYPDPAQDDPKLVVVDVEAVRPLPHEVTLAAMKARKGLQELGLIRQSRLSVVPVTAAHWKILTAMAKL